MEGKKKSEVLLIVQFWRGVKVSHWYLLRQCSRFRVNMKQLLAETHVQLLFWTLKMNTHDCNYKKTSRRYKSSTVKCPEIRSTRGQQCCSAPLGIGFMAGVGGLRAFGCSSETRRRGLHHLLTLKTKPAGHACLLEDGPTTMQCDTFLSSVSCRSFSSMAFHQTLSRFPPRAHCHDIRASRFVS